MASSKNTLLKNFSGTVGDLVVKQVGDKTIISSKPRQNKNRKKSDIVLHNQQKFRAASTYARAAMKDPELSEIYKAACRRDQKPFHLAFKDYIEGPVLSVLRTFEYYGLAGQPLTVRATDNFRVTRVRFALLSPGGTFMETGEAVRDLNGVDWVYITQVNNRSLKGTLIRVTAEDLAKNKTMLEVVL